MSHQVEPGRQSRRCLFCGYPIPAELVTADGPETMDRDPADGYCSVACRRAGVTGQEPFAGRHEYKRCATCVSMLDTLLPGGIRSDSLV